MAELLAEQVAELLAELRAGNKVSIPTALPGPQLHWLPFYPADFFGNPMVGAMENIAEGRPQYGYFKSLVKSWQMKEPCFIPNDRTLIAGLIGCTELELQGEWKIVLDRFEQTEDGRFIFNRRLLKEYAEARHIHESRRKGGREAHKNKAERSAQPVAEPELSTSSAKAEHVAEGVSSRTQPHPQPQPHIKTREREVAPDDLDALTEEIGHLHPANNHLKGKFLPENQKYEIAEAIIRDGAELVRAGTLNYRDAVAKWPKSDLRFVMNPVRFYSEDTSEYLKDPVLWERGMPAVKVGTTRQRAMNDAIDKAFS